VCAVGSASRHDEPADICPSADYVEFGAPGGQRQPQDGTEKIWGCGGDGDYIEFTGGCMACAFASGIAALAFSRYPQLTNDQVRQIMRNTARSAEGVEYDASGWEPKLGYGILDAAACVSLKEGQLCRDVRVLSTRVGGSVLHAQLENHGAYDAESALVTAFNGDPPQPADPGGTSERPAELLRTKQIGHAIARVRGLHRASVSVELIEEPGPSLWIEVYCLDRHDEGRVHRAKTLLP
jgi:hypothetical protein